MKKIFSSFLILITLFTIISCNFSEPYSDVGKDSEYYQPSLLLRKLNLISESGPDGFHPELPITKKEICHTFAILSGADTEKDYPSLPTDFTPIYDIRADDPYANDMYFALSNEIVTADSCISFRPDAEVIIEDFAVYLSNFIEKFGYTSSIDTGNVLAYDFGINTREKECMRQLIKTGVLLPEVSEGPLTRGEYSICIYNFYNNYHISESAEKSTIYEDYPDFITAPVRKSDARDVYVDASGDPVFGDGTFKNPYAKIATAVKNALPGDRIRVFGGTYNEAIRTSIRGESDNWIIIEPYNSKPVKIDGRNELGCTFIFEEGAGYCAVRGFEMYNYSGAGVWNKGDTDHLYLENLYIHDISNPAFSPYGTEGILGAGDEILVRGCYIKDIGLDRLSASDHGIYLGPCSKWVMDANTFKNIPGGGIHQFKDYEDVVYASDCLVTNNIFIENLYHIVLSSCEGFTITNNTFFNAKETDFYILNHVENNFITNNIFYNDHKSTDLYKKGTWNAYSIRDNEYKSYFIFADDPSGFKNNLFENNFFKYESMPIRIKIGGSIKNANKIDRIGNVEKTNEYSCMNRAEIEFFDKGSEFLKPSDQCSVNSLAKKYDYSPTHNITFEKRKVDSVGAY